MVLYEGWTPVPRPYEGGGSVDTGERGDSGGGENKKQSARINALRTSRYAELRRRGYGGHLPPGKQYAPGNNDFLLAVNRNTPQVPGDFVPTTATGFQLPQNQGAPLPELGPQLGSAPTYIKGAPKEYTPPPVNPIWAGAGTGFLLPQNRPPPKK